MNARWVPSIALAPGLRSRSDCFGGVGKEGVLRRVPPYDAYGEVPRPPGLRSRSYVGGGRPWGSTVKYKTGIQHDTAATDPLRPRANEVEAARPFDSSLGLCWGSRSGFRPTGVVEGATGLPVGLHSPAWHARLDDSWSQVTLQHRGGRGGKPGVRRHPDVQVLRLVWAWSSCYLLPLLLAPDERFAMRFKTQAHCLLPKGFPSRPFSTRNNAA